MLGCQWEGLDEGKVEERWGKGRTHRAGLDISRQLTWTFVQLLLRLVCHMQPTSHKHP